MTAHVDVMTGDEADRLAAPTEDAGLGALGTGRGNLPLDCIELRAVVTGLATRIELSQRFHNPYDEPLEATYIFPLPSRAAVTALRMEADGRVVEGLLKERGEARAEYDRAVTEGKRASIAEEERPGVFTMRVGNIVPGEGVTIRLTLVGQLPYEDGVATLRFPLVVAPRYIPGTPLPGDPVGDGTTLDTDTVPDASRITPPVLLPGFPNPVRLSAEVQIDPAGLPLAGVQSSLHVTTVDETAGRITVRLHPGERVNRDFVLRLRLGSDDAIATSLAVLADPDGPDGASHGGAFALTVLPPVATAPPRPRDVVLVLDRSGSMSGWKMVAARRAAARIVDTLTGRDRFAVLAFDNVVETPAGLPTGLLPATDRHRFRAVEHLAGLSARGGTEMLAPLTQAADLLAGPAGSDQRDRVLVLVTDGQIGNEHQILRTMFARLEGVRVHTVGVDTAVNEAFLRRLAQQAGGRCELVESEDRLDEAMRNIHRRIGGPLVTALALHPEGLQIEPDTIAPAPLPELFPGAPVVIGGRYQGAAGGARITVSGRAVGGGEWRATAEAGPGDAGLSAVWARARVRDLEDRYATGELGAGEPAALEELERAIVATSLRFGVLSRFTAFVAVDTRVVTEGGVTRRVTQPVDLPQGWDASALVGAPPATASPMFAAFLPHSAAAGGLARGRFAGSPAPAAAGRLLKRAVAGRDHGGVPREPASEVSALVAEFAAAELRVLREADRRAADQGASEDQGASTDQGASADRAELLAALADRLAELLARAAGEGVSALVLRPLRDLAAELAAPVTTLSDVEHRWLHAMDVLEAFGAESGTPPVEPRAARPAPKRAGVFWRR